jgi:ankyrin repeat protein
LRHLIDLGVEFRGGGPAQVFPLMSSVLSNQAALTRILIEAGADPSPTDRLGMNALHLAANRGCPEPLKYCSMRRLAIGLTYRRSRI